MAGQLVGGGEALSREFVGVNANKALCGRCNVVMECVAFMLFLVSSCLARLVT